MIQVFHAHRDTRNGERSNERADTFIGTVSLATASEQKRNKPKEREFNMGGYGDYSTSDYTKVKNGMYPATITGSGLVMENGKPKELTSDGGAKKKMVKVDFQLDSENEDGGIEISRQLTLTYGKNKQTAAYSAWSTLIHAATGIVCGDRAQFAVGDEDLRGKRVMLRIKNVESNGNKYSNIVDFEPLEDAPRVEEKTSGPYHNPPGEDESEIPF
jgi:hypothetical protein